MPSLLDTYSLNSGLKIEKTKPLEYFYPVPEKYITLQTSSGMDSKNYDYWIDVLQYIHEPLSKLGYKILHIGVNCPEMPFCENLVNKNNFNQTNYVLRNSKLHLGNDSFAVHLAGSHDVPIVALYGATSPINHGPYFGTKKKLIESHRNGKNPSFSSQENPKTVNFIKPEEVANAVFELLDIETIKEETLFIGEKYGKQIIEVVPNVVVNPQSLSGNTPTMRCDYDYKEEFLIENLKLTKYSIITDKETDLDIYRNFKQNISSISFKVNENSSLEYIRGLKKIGLPLALWTDDEENLSKIRFHLLDIDQVQFSGYKKHDFELLEEYYYKSYKYILSDGKIYMSKQDFLNDEPINSPQENIKQIPKKNLDFQKEMEYFRIINYE